METNGSATSAILWVIISTYNFIFNSYYHIHCSS